MTYTPKRFNITLLSSTDSELLRLDYQAEIDSAAQTQLAKSLAVSAYVTFFIPGALEADYNLADQAKKEVMADLWAETRASGQDFDTYYTARYNELYP